MASVRAVSGQRAVTEARNSQRDTKRNSPAKKVIARRVRPLRYCPGPANEIEARQQARAVQKRSVFEALIQASIIRGRPGWRGVVELCCGGDCFTGNSVSCIGLGQNLLNHGGDGQSFGYHPVKKLRVRWPSRRRE